MNTRSLGNRYLVSAALIALLSACADETPSPPAAPPAGVHHEHMNMAADDPLGGQSLHQLEARWTDQQGKDVQFADFAGQIVVLAMAYTHCEHACPRIIADMRRIQNELVDAKQDLSFVLASVDPERDTVEHLQQFARSSGLNDRGWRLIRAPDETVRELAAVLGVQYRRVSESDFAHSNIITVLGPGGEIRHQQKGLGVKPDATIAAIRDLD